MMHHYGDGHQWRGCSEISDALGQQFLDFVWPWVLSFGAVALLVAMLLFIIFGTLAAIEGIREEINGEEPPK